MNKLLCCDLMVMTAWEGLRDKQQGFKADISMDQCCLKRIHQTWDMQPKAGSASWHHH